MQIIQFRVNLAAGWLLFSLLSRMPMSPGKIERAIDKRAVASTPKNIGSKNHHPFLTIASMAKLHEMLEFY